MDLDDGSSNYKIYNNLMLNGGLKLREGYGRIATNNIIINNVLHPHCWFDNSGDVFRNNIVMAAYKPAGGMPNGKWGKEIDYNIFACSQQDRLKFAAIGCDEHSTVAAPEFLNPENGDFRVRTDSAVLKLGFQNFPMDEFGVVSSRLRAMAKHPEIPAVNIRLDYESPSGSRKVYVWREARLRDMEGEEFSAYGVGRDSGGILIMDVQKEGLAGRDGFLSGDLIQSIDETPVITVAQMMEYLYKVSTQKDIVIGIVRTQKPTAIIVHGGVKPSLIALPKSL